MNRAKYGKSSLFNTAKFLQVFRRYFGRTQSLFNIMYVFRGG